jgi:DNA excision repair protein ERCC-5
MPDLDALRRFLYSMLGWDEKKVDGLVVPVIKEMNSRKVKGYERATFLLCFIYSSFLSIGCGAGVHWAVL